MKTELRVAVFGVNPPALTLFKSFDPDSNVVISAICDALVYIDEDGAVQPALAVGWRQLSPTLHELDLRQGVFFHNGDPFGADDVVATFEAHRTPTPSPLAKGVLSPIVAVRKVSDSRVHIETRFPDAMFLRRLFLAAIYPKGVLEREGRDALSDNPIGTGAYRLVRFDRDRELVLERNVDHWAGMATVDTIRLPIIRQKEWVTRLAKGEIDVAWNLDSLDVVRARQLAGIETGSREAAIAQYFTLSQRGPLSDVRVRRALNHAVNRHVLAGLTEHGLGAPQRGAATRATEGYCAPSPYRYSVDLARQLLDEAGYGSGFELRGLVSETSTSLFSAVREFLSRVGVELEAEIVPRSVWMKTVVGANLSGGALDADFAVTSCDNPLLHALFLQYAFFNSHGPFSFTRSGELDRLFAQAATSASDGNDGLARLERYTRDQALMLFTVEQQVHAAWRRGVSVTLPRSGHFNAIAFWKLRVDGEGAPDRPTVSMPAEATPTPAGRDLDLLQAGTSHLGGVYLPPGTVPEGSVAKRVWENLLESEERARVQNAASMRELVKLVEAKGNLANVLRSTDRVGIVGYSPERRELFRNRGFDAMLGEDRSVFDVLGHVGEQGWPAILERVTRDGAWQGPIRFTKKDGEGRSAKLFLTVTPARDDDGAEIGHTFVFSDFSDEEERIKNAATRLIVENVPYGLFALDREGRMKPGYSDACREMFASSGSVDLAGTKLVTLLGMNERDATNFGLQYEQCTDDVLPDEVAVGQLPERVSIEGRTFRLSGAILRSDDGRIEGVLFTMLDITAQLRAETEVERCRATIAVLESRDEFESFVVELANDLTRFGAAPHPSLVDREVRMALHTAKGIFAQFELRHLAEAIHRLEDCEVISSAGLLELLGELAATLRRNEKVWKISLQAHEPVHTVADSFLRDLEERAVAASDLDHLRVVLHEGIRSVRERRASTLLSPLRAMAQAQARRREKADVELVIEGGDVGVPPELTRVLATVVHLVRNAVDHGVENAGERGEKCAVATVRIQVSRSERELRLTVSDDGRGVDLERLVTSAVERGALDEESARALTDRQKLDLVFMDGVSTASSLTEISGRGVGVAATKAAVEGQGGRITVESEIGVGTCFTIVLPVSPPSGHRQADPRPTDEKASADQLAEIGRHAMKDMTYDQTG